MSLHFLPDSGIINTTENMVKTTADKRFSLVYLLALLLLPVACATPVPRAGTDKNSMPFFAKEQVAEVHSIAIPPFFNDRHAWRIIAAETAASLTAITIISSEETAAAMQREEIELASVSPDERPEVLARIGSAVQADAVLNGLIITREGSDEIILQLIASRDGRVLWWQATDLFYGSQEAVSRLQQSLLEHMLSQLLAHTGTREKKQINTPVLQDPETKPKAEQELKPEIQKKPDGQPRSEKKQKPSKKPGKGSRPQPSAESISPM